MQTPSLRVIAEGLRFPEGPVWLDDGSIALVEIERQTVSLVRPDGRVEVLAEVPGGPNGLARGPDGAFYVCNCGGFGWIEEGGLLTPSGTAPGYQGGSIDRVDPQSGKVTTLYTHCGDRRLSGPNDLVFDAHGGFYFTDIGKIRPHDRDHGGVYYATIDGSRIEPVIYPILSPNGCGLSPDGRRLYVADMEPARLWAFDIIGPGQLAKLPFPRSGNGGHLLGAATGFQGFDSLAVDAEGSIAIGTVWGQPQITVIAANGGISRQIPMPDPFPTNLCFGGEDRRTAFITLSGRGQLVAMPWHCEGMTLSFQPLKAGR